MKVDAVFGGILSRWVGTERAAFELTEGGSYEDLLRAIGERYGSGMPEHLWDREAGNFRGSIVALASGRSIESVKSRLHGGEEIVFLLMLLGG